MLDRFKTCPRSFIPAAKAASRLFLCTACASVFLIWIQDFFVFPRLWEYFSRWDSPVAAGSQVRHEVKSGDGTLIEIFEHEAGTSVSPRPYTAVLFHGNGQLASQATEFPKWLASLGIKSYTVEYRGYGRTGGWPSEKNLYADASAAWDYIKKREKAGRRNIIVLGQSIGTGIAAWLAAQKQPAAVVLISGYSSLSGRAREDPALGWLAPLFFRYKVPTAEYLASLKDTCVILAHGKRDSIIGFHHNEALAKAVSAGVQKKVIVSDAAGHDDLMSIAGEEITGALLSCLKRPQEAAHP